MFKNLRNECESFFRVVASKIIDLLKDVFIVEWQEFVEEDWSIKSIGLSEIGCIQHSILSVWNWMNHSDDENPSSMAVWAIVSASGYCSCA